ncbi:hypothetical protein [Flavobacteriaceae bacterium 14752]|uniref:hypothetical protein n=1 Tax=Mesohalobacter salilacus TaxID=2491711 RepID=UPI000F635096|nr:hypothetical protein EIG84_09250 [Flavobacteriaceae bacterium 14752]
MDITAQIKNNLITRIKASQDLNFLKALQTIIDSSEQKLYQLSSKQKDSITTGRRQIKDGQMSSNESVIFEMKEWLTKE